MFKERLISGIIMVIIALITGITGGYLFYGTVLAISLIGLAELYRIVRIQNKLPGYIGYVFTTIYFIMLNSGYGMHILPLFLLFLISLMAAYVFSFPKYKSHQIALSFFGFFYVSVMLSHVYMTRMLPSGIFTLWLIFFCSWGCDTCAYCAGMLWGKRKMSPILSPKKSVEGAIGGVIGAALLGLVYGAVVNACSSLDVNPFIYALICAIGGLISMVGDLAASGFKRDNKIKDYGSLIPGHGGILDRFDSVIFTAPVIYYLAYHLM